VFSSTQSLVEVKDNLACASTIGRIPGQSQVLSLAPGCLVVGANASFDIFYTNLHLHSTHSTQYVYIYTHLNNQV